MPPAGDPTGVPPLPQDQGIEPMPNDSGMQDAPAEEGTGDPKKDEIMDILNSVTSKDVETILAYARSRKDASEEGAENNPEEGMPADDPNAMPQQPMQESVIFSKKQLKKIHESINGEVVMPDGEDEKVGHSTKTANKKESPFDPPKTVKKLKEEEPKGYGISKHMDQGEDKFVKPQQNLEEEDELDGYSVPDGNKVGGEQKFTRKQ